MKTDPLTHRFKHETREIDPDPMDWFERPEHAAPVMRSVVIALTIVAIVVVIVWWVPA